MKWCCPPWLQLERSAAKAEAFTYLTELNPAVDDAPQLQYPSDVFFLSQIAELRVRSRGGAWPVAPSA